VATRSREAVGDLLVALSDPTRRRAFELLVDTSPTTATALARQLNVSRQAVAKHLVQLAESGLASSRRVGRETLYHADTSGLDDLITWAGRTRDLWARRLDRL
jgi:DNA-binding transcriptional ArsR family regulator